MGKWLFSIAVLALALAGCGSGETPTRQNDFTPLTSIAITSTVVTLPVGVSIKLTATGNFSGLFTRDITSQVVWSSTQPGTANFVSLPGYVTALLPGVAPITATMAGVSSDDFLLTVNDAVITTLTVAPLLPTLPLGLSQAFTVQGTFTDGTTFDLTKDVTWSSSDATVATISNAFASKGTAKSEKLGTTTIAAQFGTYSPASTTLSVVAASLTKIVIDPASASLLSLSNRSFSATGTFSDTSSRVITSEVTWESSAPTVATVASASLVQALAPGSATIKATLGTVSGTSNLKVTGGSLNNIALTFVQANNNVLIKGTRSRVTARGTFSNGTSRDITGAVTLTVDSANASVTPVGGNLAWVQAQEVTPLATPAKISASYGSLLPGESLLTVTAPTLNTGGLSISALALTLAIGSSERLSLTGLFSSGNSQNLTPSAEWSFVPAAPASVGNVGLEKGRVTALAAGTAEIAATYNAQTVTATVTAVARTLQSLLILPVTSPDPLIPGTEKQLMVEALYADGARQDVTADAVWSIDNVNVAKFSDQLSDPGLIVAVDVGSAILTATFGGKEDTETITVSQ